jgi:hypothetical protein
MMSDNLFEFLDEIQKLALKAKVQNILDMSVKDDRVHDVLNADVVIEYYNKMHEHYEKNPKGFLFPHREWITESLERLSVDLSNVFDECGNVDYIKREEVIVLFMLLWVHMVIQNPIRIEVIKDPYDLFYIWTKNRVFIARPTETHYLQDGDRRVLDRLGKSYGWFTGVHHFSIGLKGAVEYHYSSPDDITNINGAYNKVHGSVTKLRDMNDWAMSRLTKEQYKLAHADKLHRPSQFRYMRKGIKFGPHEEECRHKVARNTKFVVREMTGYSNTSYKILLEDYYRTKFDKSIDPYIKEIVNVLAKDYGVGLDSDFISYAKKHATAKPDSPFQTVAIIDIINAMIKLKEKLNEEKDQ